jgi:hypothetical protein
LNSSSPQIPGFQIPGFGILFKNSNSGLYSMFFPQLNHTRRENQNCFFRAYGSLLVRWSLSQSQEKFDKRIVLRQGRDGRMLRAAFIIEDPDIHSYVYWCIMRKAIIYKCVVIPNNIPEDTDPPGTRKCSLEKVNVNSQNTRFRH